MVLVKSKIVMDSSRASSSEFRIEIQNSVRRIRNANLDIAKPEFEGSNSNSHGISRFRLLSVECGSAKSTIRIHQFDGRSPNYVFRQRKYESQRATLRRTTSVESRISKFAIGAHDFVIRFPSSCFSIASPTSEFRIRH